MADRLTASARLDAFDFEAASAQALRWSGQSQARQWRAVGPAIALLALSVAGAFLLPEPWPLPAMLLAAALYIFWAVRWRRGVVRRVFAKFNAARWRQGVTTITLDAEGVALEHPGMTCRFAWSHAEDVIDGRDGLLVMVGPAEYVPLPRASFPAGETAESLKARIKGWISAARSTEM